MYFTLEMGMEGLKSLLAMILLFLFCVSIPYFFVPCVLYRFCSKDKVAAHPFSKDFSFQGSNKHLDVGNFCLVKQNVQ